MEYRQLGTSGLNVPVLSFGTATFGGTNEFFNAWGATQVDEARQLIDLCMEAGVNLFDTANIYSRGVAEEILGKAIAHLQRDQILISTKATFPMGDGPNDFGSGRLHLTKQVEDSLKRLNTDYIDIYHMHGFDANTPVEETLKTLDNLIQSGKVKYIAASNFSGWHLMKSLSIAERYGWSKYIGHQVLYSLYDREFESELMPLAIDQNVGTMVWSPLSSGKLGGRYDRDKEIPTDNRIQQGGAHGAAIDYERLFTIVDALKVVAEQTGKTVPQVALNWLLQRPTVANIIVGARNEAQLKQNLAAVGWNLTIDQIKMLDEASNVYPIYPYWHQQQNTKLVPQPKFY